MSKILVVDDEQSICWGFVKLGESMGHKVATAASAEEGLRWTEENTPDLLILDVRLPGMDGLTAMQHFRQRIGTAPIIIITAFGGLDIAVEAVRSEAFEYVLKPFDLAEVRAIIERALQSERDTPPLETPEVTGEMVGSTPAMQTLFKRIALAASADANVLVQGESGVGKDLAARAIHRYSKRADKNFVAVNVAALSSTLAESELFGHVSGAFTGADGVRDGLLVQADGGTLFLDEVADIPLPMQVKLLRALEQGEVLPVGSDTPIKTDFRVIAATHQDLQSLVRAGKFRHDLYFRICAFEITIPSLRERAEDIPLLAAHFVSQLDTGSLTLGEEVLIEMQRRPWHGNVRELRNAIEHAGVVARSGVVHPEHLPAEQPCLQSDCVLAPAGNNLKGMLQQRAEELLKDSTAHGEIYDKLLQEVEGPLLSIAMQKFDNECAPAARALGLHRTTLKKKLEQLDLQERDEE